MTELTFLIELLLNHRLPKATRDAVAGRIKEVEGNIGLYPQPQKLSISPPPIAQPPGMAPQAASTLAALARHPDLVQQMSAPAPIDTPVTVIAQTPAAAAAMAQRQASIMGGLSGKPAPGETRPRKF